MKWSLDCRNHNIMEKNLEWYFWRACVNMLSPDPSLPVLQLWFHPPHSWVNSMPLSVKSPPPPLLCTAAVMRNCGISQAPESGIWLLKADRVGMAMGQTSDLSQEEWSGAGCWSGGPFDSQNFFLIPPMGLPTYSDPWLLPKVTGSNNSESQAMWLRNHMLSTFMSNWGSQDAAFKSHLLNKIIL